MNETLKTLLVFIKQYAVLNLVRYESHTCLMNSRWQCR